MNLATARNVSVTAKPTELESFWHGAILGLGNANLAREMGVHPTALSRDKARIVRMASRMVHELGLPDGCIAHPDCGPSVTITGDEAKKLLSMLSEIRG